MQKSPQVVKHVVKGEKWACSTLDEGKNKPIYYVMKTRDFKRFCEINKEKSGILRLPIFGLSDKTWTCGLYHPNGVRLVCKSANIVEYLPISLIFRGFRLLFGKYRLLKKCTRCRKNTILYQNFVPDFSAFQGFCGFCLKELYHIFLKKSSAESYLFEN